MDVLRFEDLPIVFDAGGAQIRATDVGGMTVTFYRLPAGADARPLLVGLPGDACHCPHWAYVITGKVRIHTPTGAVDVNAGEGFHVEPGHAPETLEDTELFEVSPTPQSHELWEHLGRLLEVE